MKKILCLILSALMLASCGNSAIDENSIQDDSNETYTNTEVNSLGKENILKISAAEPVKTAIDDNFIDILSNFSEKLYTKVSESNSGNIIFSPLSVMYALSLCANGAGGETLEQFESVLGASDIASMNNYLYTLTQALGETKESTVKCANSVWGNEELFEISDAFADVAHRYYSAEAMSKSFNDSKTLTEINKWVSDNTDGMITDALDGLDPTSVMVLLNTVLFDGIWENEYEEYDINDGFFTNYDGTRSDVEYMYSTEYSYFTVDGGQGFSKAYKDGYSFVAVLPNDDIRDFVKTLDVKEILNSAENGSDKVDVSIPKFEYDSTIGLTDVLIELGLENAFSSSAELGGLQQNGENNICISEVLQKAKVITNEHGTKAAAVTEFNFATTSLMPETLELYLDRPFFYMITNSDGAVLFMGTVENLG